MNIVERIRRWLIRKLGGYVEPPGTFIPAPGPNKITIWDRCGVDKRTIHPAKVEACTSVDPHFIAEAKRSGVDAGERIMHVLATEMTKILFREGLIKLCRADNPRLADCTYRGTIFVIRPEDAGIFGYQEDIQGEWEEVSET